MPCAQVHYPFENADWFEHHFPGDFIVEYIGQTRGWFYTLHILASAIFDKPAFSTCLSHGIVLGSDGNKMSKSLRNYPDVREVFDRDGADAMRWFLMSSPILRGGNLVVTEQGIRDSVRQVMIPLWNSWYFFQLYANAASYDAQWSTGSTDPLDRYLLAKCRQYVEAMTHQLDNYEVANACDSTRAFLDVLTNWYIRRSRDRFWGDDQQAFDTLYTVLEVACRATAPLMPLTTEEVWRGLTGGRSVHLTDWPLASDLPADDALVAAMDQVRDVCSATSALRKAGNLRNRLPLSTLTVVVADAASLTGFEGIVADEVNVKTVRLLDASAPEAAAYGVSQRLTVNARAAGPRLGKDVQTAIKGSKSGDWSVAEDGTVTSGGLTLEEGEYTLETVAGSADDGAATGMLPHGGFVVLDTVVTPELAAEGLARDLVRAVQQARRDGGLDVSDRIALTIGGSEAVLEAARAHEALITGETLATSYDVDGTGDTAGTTVVVGDGETAIVRVARNVAG
jgi:isoleucyl-tRNA synthetase